MATVRVSFLLGGERFHGRLNRSSVLSDVPAKATRVNRAGPGYKVIRLRRLSYTRQALQRSYPRPKSLDLLKRVVAVLPDGSLRAVSNSFAAIASSSRSLVALSVIGRSHRIIQSCVIWRPERRNLNRKFSKSGACPIWPDRS